MITGLAVRLSQGLGLNVESSTYPTTANCQPSPMALKESRRRLMWAIYVMDAWVGSGVNELTLLNESNIKVYLYDLSPAVAIVIF